MLKQFNLRKAPPPPPVPAPNTRSPMERLGDMALARMPYVPQIRLFWQDLEEMRHAWWYLLPLLAWFGWRSYHAERRRLLREQIRTRQQPRT